MMLSYIWTIRLCQSCHMLHMAIMAIMAQSDYIMPHSNQAIMAIMGIMTQSDYIMPHGNQAIMAIMTQSDYNMPHATHGCPYCVMLWGSQQGRWEKTPSNFVQNQVFIGESQKVFPKDVHFMILKRENVFCSWNHSKLRHSHWHWMLHHWNYLIKPWLTHKIEEIVYIHKKVRPIYHIKRGK